MITTSLIVSCLIFLLIAIRQWLPPAVRIWHIMVAGAIGLLVLGQITPAKALAAIDWNVIAYLFGVFAIGAALYDAGVSHVVGRRIASMKSPSAALAVVIIAATICSALLTNDASAIIGTPIILMLARALRLPAGPLLIALCATVTVGSMISPVGNPQNILIATRGHFGNPVATFLLWLTVPTILSLVAVYLWSRFLISRDNREPAEELHDLPEPSANSRAWTAYLGLGLLVILIGADSALQSMGNAEAIPFGVASIIACAPIFLFSPNRITVLKTLDWSTLAFFLAMFIVTGSLLQSGALQAMLGERQADLGDLPVIALVSFWASQVFSNVPVVEIYLNLVKDWEIPELMMLAGISTLAGNLFIISAASNVIVVQQAERFGKTPFTFWQFTFGVLPITIASFAITYFWIAWFSSVV
ncbi:MAG: SLC13 family permease [Pseudomonadota bacterium]